MSDAPERIWLLWNGWWVLAHRLVAFQWRPDSPEEAPEYRRADLPPTLAEALALPEIAALVKALEFYADPETYKRYPEKYMWMWPPIDDDEGQCARAALAAVKEAGG